MTTHPKDTGLKFARTIKPKRKSKKARTPEDIIQAQAEEYMDRLSISYVRIPNAVYRLLFAFKIGLSGREIGERKRISDYLKGLPDLICLRKGRYLAVELKTDTGKLSAKQKLWRVSIGTEVCRSFEEFRELVDKWRDE